MASVRLLRVVVLLLYIKNAYSQQPISSILNLLKNSHAFQSPTNYNNYNQSGQKYTQQVNLQELFDSMNLDNFQQQVNVHSSQQKPVATGQLTKYPGKQNTYESLTMPYSGRTTYSDYNTNVPMGQTSGQQNKIGHTKSSKQNQPKSSVMNPSPSVNQQSLVIQQSKISEQGDQRTQTQSSVQNLSEITKQEPRLKLIAGQPIITSIQFVPTGTSPGSVETSQESNFKTIFHPISPAIIQKLYQSQQNQETIQIQPGIADSIPVQFTFDSGAPTISNQPMVSYLTQPYNSIPVQQSIPLIFDYQPESQVQAELDLSSLIDKPCLLAEASPPLSPMQSLMQYIFSEMQSTSTPKYPVVPSYPGSKQESKSSIKSILPLILDLLQERNCGCDNHRCIDKNDNINQEPQIFCGYSNQMVYGQRTKEARPVINNNLETDIDKSRNELQNNLTHFIDSTNSSEISDEDDSEDSSEYVEDE